MSRPNKRQRQQARRQRKAERRVQRPVEPRPVQAPLAATVEPVRGALAPVIDDALHWHLARTAARLGPLGRKALDEALCKQEVPAYRPRATEIVVRRGRRVVRQVPLLVRTLIIGVRDEDHLDVVAALPGIGEIVAHPEVEANSRGNVPGLVWRPARLDPNALQRFLVGLAADEIVRPLGIGAGSAVMVVSGPFASFPATVEAVLPGDRIKVAIAIFGRLSRMELGIAEVVQA